MSFIQSLVNGETQNTLINIMTKSNDPLPLISQHDEDRWNVLHHAANLNYNQLISICLEHSVDLLDRQTVQGFTPLYIAGRKGNDEAVELFLSRGADPNLTDGHGQTVLHRACENMLENVATILIDYPQANLDITDLMGRTPLHWACSKGLLNVVSLLFERGALIKTTTGGETPLHWASRSGNEDIVSLLLQYKPDINIYEKNERDESAVDLAKNADIANFLRAHAESMGISDDGNLKIQNVNISSGQVHRLDGQPKKKIEYRSEKEKVVNKLKC